MGVAGGWPVDLHISEFYNFVIGVSIHTDSRMHSIGVSAYGRIWHDILLTYLITI